MLYNYRNNYHRKGSFRVQSLQFYRAINAIYNLKDYNYYAFFLSHYARTCYMSNDVCMIHAAYSLNLYRLTKFSKQENAEL